MTILVIGWNPIIARVCEDPAVPAPVRLLGKTGFIGCGQG